jgi:probable phosphoglycerate mutase
MESGIFGKKVVPVESIVHLSLLREQALANHGHRSPEQVTRRIDRLITDIRQKYHAPVIGKPKNSEVAGDVLLVAHGHILRAFAMRWVGKTLAEGPTFLLEAGGVGTLSYEHHELAEPAILLGGGFMVDVVEKSERLGQEEGEQ